MIRFELAPIVFGLSSAVFWGAGDFCGGLATKRTQVYRVIISSQLVSLILLAILAIATQEPLPPLDQMLLAGAAGVIGNAGTVNTGAIDNLNAIADLCQREKLWFHVDGAIGALAAVSPDLRPLLKGMERADSITFDLRNMDIN